MIQYDQYYTKPEVAKLCVRHIDDLDSYDNIIEPSAGNGAFLEYLPKYEAYDILPEHKDIIRQDFLLLDKNYDGKTLFIGNPPFGKRYSLAKAFIKKCIELNAYTVAFILPDTFKKRTNQGYNIFPKQYYLQAVIDLPHNSFFNGKEEYDIPCAFFIWTRDKCNDLRNTIKETTNDFIFLKRGDINCDFCLNGNSGIIKDIGEVVNPKAEHYIKCIASKEKVYTILSKLSYPKLSSVSGKNYWINQGMIIHEYNKENNK